MGKKIHKLCFKKCLPKRKGKRWYFKNKETILSTIKNISNKETEKIDKDTKKHNLFFLKEEPISDYNDDILDNDLNESQDLNFPNALNISCNIPPD